MCFLAVCLQADMAYALDFGIDGELLHFDVKPELKNNTYFVPIRQIAEKMNAKIQYTDKGVIIENFDTTNSRLIFNIGSTDVSLQAQNGEELAHYKLNFAPYVKDGRTLLPIRFVSEQMGCVVTYKPGLVRIIIPGKAINGQPVFSVNLSTLDESNSLLIDHKQLVNKLIDLIYSSKCEQVDKPADCLVRDQFGATYKFLDCKGAALAVWQFVVPASEVDEFIDYSKMYLYDVLNNQYYVCDSEIFSQFFTEDGGLLELRLGEYWGGKSSIY
jgi:hypothetical protein